MRRTRFRRLLADLSIVQLVPASEHLIKALTADACAASARALARLGVTQAKPLIQPLLQDPVQDVRKAAQTALRSLGDKEVRSPTLPATRLADGARSWSVGEANDAGNENDWKARLRAMMGE